MVPVVVSLLCYLFLQPLPLLLGIYLIALYNKTRHIIPYNVNTFIPSLYTILCIYELITGILSARMKKPRNGLYISSILGLFFVLPPLGIVYLTNNHLLWSIIYCIILAVVNVICLAKISNRISRPQLMNWI